MDWYTSLEFQAVLNSIVRSKMSQVFVMIFKFTIAVVAIVSSMVCQLQKQKIHRGLEQAQARTVVWWPLISDE